MQILARAAGAVLAIFDKAFFQQTKVVGFRPEIADVTSEVTGFADCRIHFRAGEMVKAVAFQLSGTQAKLLKYFTKCQAGGGGACSAGAGNCYNRMFC
ncbi:hypothetical protein D3C80_1792810 [compost metagenome]